jgi:8-oxo-dGTP diphosphatase
MRATLLFVRRGDEVLLIRKKRGLGAGKINGPGGRIDPGETAAECAVREVREELGILARDPIQRGELHFQFVDGLALHCAVFTATRFEGEPVETAEAIPRWTKTDAVPYDEMWADDRCWFPGLLEGREFRAWFDFDGDSMLSERVEWVRPGHFAARTQARDEAAR